MTIATPWPVKLPDCLIARREGDVAILCLNRPNKRNSLSDDLVLGIQAFFGALPAEIKAVVLHGAGNHFCAGLDLNEIRDCSVPEGIRNSMIGQRATDMVQFSQVPVVVALHGAVIGGGLELAAACHIRVAEKNAFYALPEGQRGIFLGSGGSVRLPGLIGMARAQDMMLTGRVYTAEEGYPAGFSHYLVEDGQALDKALELAKRIAANAPLTNFAILQAWPRIAEAAPATGLLAESLMAGIAQGDIEAKARLREFLEKRAPKVAVS